VKRNKNVLGGQENQPAPVMEIQGQVLSSEDRFWLDTAKQLTHTSIPATEEAARQVIGLVSLLQGILFAVVTVSDLKAKLIALTGQVNFWILLLLILLPIGCWITSLWLCVLVFLPKSYSIHLRSPEISRAVFNEIVEYKHKRLLQAYSALAAGFIPLLFAVIIYLLA
jgi:hypothetical protein